MGPAFLRLWLPWTQEPPRGASPEGHSAPPLWMTTVSSHEAHGVSTLTLTFSTSRIPGEEPCGTVVCTESSFGWRVLGVQWRQSLRGRVRSSPAQASHSHLTTGSGLPSTPPPKGGRPCPDAATLLGSRCLEGLVHHCGQGEATPVHTWPVADVCVWAPGLNAPEPSPQEQRRSPALVTPEECSCPSDVDRALVRTV